MWSLYDLSYFLPCSEGFLSMVLRSHHTGGHFSRIQENTSKRLESYCHHGRCGSLCVPPSCMVHCQKPPCTLPIHPMFWPWTCSQSYGPSLRWQLPLSWHPGPPLIPFLACSGLPLVGCCRGQGFILAHGSGTSSHCSQQHRSMHSSQTLS